LIPCLTGSFCRLGLRVPWLFSLADFFGSGFWFCFFLLSLRCLRRLASWLFACGVGPSLHFYRSISFAPCAGRHLLSLPPRRKESKQRKRAATASP
jgi:hypothetical protein